MPFSILTLHASLCIDTLLHLTRSLSLYRTRRDGRPNGTATLTLRRSSTTPFNQSAMHSATDNNGVPTPVDEIPASADPRLASSTGSSSRTYSREQLLEISKSDTVRHMDVNRLLMPGFNPGHANGNSGRSWGKANESNGHHDPTACWDQNGNMIPLGLQEMSQAEQEVGAVSTSPSHLHQTCSWLTWL